MITTGRLSALLEAGYSPADDTAADITKAYLEAAEQIRDARMLHTERRFFRVGGGEDRLCRTCLVPFPCPTLEALGGA